MASSVSSSKRLGDYLQEQQEPFSLCVYLSEQAYMLRNLSFHGPDGCCWRKPSIFRKSKGVFGASKNLKSVLRRIVSSNDNNIDTVTWKTSFVNGLPSGNPLFDQGQEEVVLPSDYQHDTLLSEIYQMFDLGNFMEVEDDINKNFRGDKKRLKQASIVQHFSKNVTMYRRSKEQQEVFDEIIKDTNMLEEWNYSCELQTKIGIEIGEAIIGEIIEQLVQLLFQYSQTK